MPKPTMRRRRFVHLMVLSAAATAGTALSSRTGAAAPSTAPARSRPREPQPDQDRRTPAVRREIENQKKTLNVSLRAVRGYALPAGSSPAFVFRPRVRSAVSPRGQREGR